MESFIFIPGEEEVHRIISVTSVRERGSLRVPRDKAKRQ